MEGLQAIQQIFINWSFSWNRWFYHAWRLLKTKKLLKKIAHIGKNCSRLLELQKVAPNAKSGSKVAEHNWTGSTKAHWWSDISTYYNLISTIAHTTRNRAWRVEISNLSMRRNSFGLILRRCRSNKATYSNPYFFPLEEKNW